MQKMIRFRLHAWRRLASKIDRSTGLLKLPRNLNYLLAGAYHSWLFRLQIARHEEALKASFPAPPVFVLGFWRSGTTLLHELLCCDPQFGFPTTYACMNPSHFLLTEKWPPRIQGSATRPMDNMSYSWASPQEDEFALLAMGAPSPYEALIVPSLMQDPRALVDLIQHSPNDQQRWADDFLLLLRLLTIQQGKTLVLKSPPHGFRLATIRAIFPESRYVVIERNPYEVFASNLRMWKTLLNSYAMESWSPELVEKFVIEAYRIHEDAISVQTSTFQPGQLAHVRYEDLVADPVGQMATIYDELKLGSFGLARQSIEQHSLRVATHKRNRFELTTAQRERVENAWEPMIGRKGYSWSDSCFVSAH
jgi:hypothetical protein